VGAGAGAAHPAGSLRPVPDAADSPNPAADRLLEGLNPEQQEAVLHTGGPLLVVAGAGSGKTRVLTNRIAHLVGTGTPPWRILAITFTNKAADEMRRRVAALVGPVAERMWVSTFHSACVRILRANAARIGYTSSFTIYDDTDSRRLIEHVLDAIGDIDPKRLPPRAILGAIGQAKSELVDAAGYEAKAHDARELAIARVYAGYERRLREANAMDFDDLLSLTARLFREAGDVLERYQERFEHVLVDEYQDTNHVQNELVLMLGREHRNVCVVGDSDQSIYRFRGADMRNILDFEHTFPDARTIVLNQNYRSTGRILKAANAVIAHNLDRQEKALWSALGDGEPLRRYRAGDERDEATFVANEIATLHRSVGVRYGDMAVFFRTNSQSRPIEQALSDRGVPYKLVGGTAFYERREVKDALAYLRALANPDDEVSLRRIVNVPRRGVGESSVAKVAALGTEMGIGFGRALLVADAAGVSGKALAGVRELVGLLDELRDGAVMSAPPQSLGGEEELYELLASVDERDVRAALIEKGEEIAGQLSFAGVGEPEPERVGPAVLLDTILERTGYREQLRFEGTIESEGRLENLAELVGVASEFGDLESFLQSTALVAATDDLDDDETRIALMTLHMAKGLEYRVVFLTGLEEELFPHNRSLDDPSAIEEERRLCYVGITRARELLYLTHTWVRTVFGQTRDTLPSRFLKEIPEDLIEDVGGGAVVGGGRGSLDRFGMSRSWGRTGPGRSGGDWNRDNDDAGEERWGSRRERSSAGGGGRSWSGSTGSAGAGGPGGPVRRPAAAVATTGAEALDLAAGDLIVHARWGEGRIVEVRGEGEKAEATIRFPRVGDKNFLLAATPLKRA
jgi:DNA helicase-2/ATP-dependent DNA helicase PcrA